MRVDITRRGVIGGIAAAAATGLATSGAASAAKSAQVPYVWQGAALGARATIRLTHPDAAAITARAAAEIDRLEDVFSLYRSGSALARLNNAGRIASPRRRGWKISTPKYME